MPFKKLNMFVKDENVKEDEILTKGIVEIYKEILRGDRKQFPKGTWMRPDSLYNATKCIKYLIEDKLRLTDEEIKNTVSTDFFKNYKLYGMLAHCFESSAFNVINHVYPDKFKPWELKTVPRNYWDDDASFKAVKWLIEDKLKLLNDVYIKRELSTKIFYENGMGSLLNLKFNCSVYNAINFIYPNRFKPWDFLKVPSGYWTKETGIEATRWLIEEKLNLSDTEIKNKLSAKLFCDNGLSGMLRHVFNNSPFEAINAAYPNKFKKEDFKNYCK